jgi:hypothetical protein
MNDDELRRLATLRTRPETKPIAEPKLCFARMKAHRDYVRSCCSMVRKNAGRSLSRCPPLKQDRSNARCIRRSTRAAEKAGRRFSRRHLEHRQRQHYVWRLKSLAALAKQRWAATRLLPQRRWHDLWQLRPGRMFGYGTTVLRVPLRVERLLRKNRKYAAPAIV